MSNLAELLKAPSASIEADEDFDAINALCLERGCGDGLPIVPPTAERVERMLAWCDRAWDEPIAKIAPRYGEATPLRLAANAVMAGCRPEYIPTFGATKAVTRALKRSDGSLARSVKDFNKK